MKFDSDKLEKISTDDLANTFYSIEWILNRRNLLPIKKNAENVVKIYVDRSCNMATVYFNREHMMTGNFHDFHPGCHGGLLSVIGTLANSTFYGYTGLAEMLKKYTMGLMNTVGGNRNGDDVSVVIKQYTGKWSHGSRPWRSLKHIKTDGVNVEQNMLIA